MPARRAAIRRSSGTGCSASCRALLTHLVQPAPQARRRQHARDPDREVPPRAARSAPTAPRPSCARWSSASLRAYLDGPETGAARRRIVVDYLNSTPLSARPGIGEINGLGDGLWAWFGSDLASAAAILREPATEPAALGEQARVYKQVLSLLLAQRRPS